MGNQALFKNTRLWSIAYGEHQLQQFDNRQVVRKVYGFEHEQQRKSFESLIFTLQNIAIKTIIPILSHKSESFYYQVLFEYYEKTLAQQIHKKITKFPQCEIIVVLTCVISALLCFKVKGLPFGDLRAQRICIKKQDGKNVYLVGLPILMNHISMERQLQRGELNSCYLSPQILQSIKQKGQSLSLSTSEKCDVFSLGMIALEMMTNRKVNDFYDLQKYQLLQLDISKNLYYCRKQYSKELCDLIENMLTSSSKQRYGFESCDRQLKKFQVKPQYPQKIRLIGGSNGKFGKMIETQLSYATVTQKTLLKQIYKPQAAQQAWLKFHNKRLYKQQ